MAVILCRTKRQATDDKRLSDEEHKERTVSWSHEMFVTINQRMTKINAANRARGAAWTAENRVRGAAWSAANRVHGVA